MLIHQSSDEYIANSMCEIPTGISDDLNILSMEDSKIYREYVLFTKTLIEVQMNKDYSPQDILNLLNESIHKMEDSGDPAEIIKGLRDEYRDSVVGMYNLCI